MYDTNGKTMGDWGGCGLGANENFAESTLLCPQININVNSSTLDKSNWGTCYLWLYVNERKQQLWFRNYTVANANLVAQKKYLRWNTMRGKTQLNPEGKRGRKEEDTGA